MLLIKTKHLENNLEQCYKYIKYILSSFDKLFKRLFNIWHCYNTLLNLLIGVVIMFSASTYEEIKERERQVENNEIVVLLFARPTDTEVLKEYEYIHYNSAEFCSIYAIGYTDNFTKNDDNTYKKVDVSISSDWYFSMKAFTEFKEELQKRINWRYSGEVEILILQNSPGNVEPLCFHNYVAVDVYKGIREGYIDSFQRFMESLIRSSKSKVTAKEAIDDMRKSRIKIKDIISDAIDECKKIPKPCKRIMKDKLFYRCGNSIK